MERTLLKAGKVLTKDDQRGILEPGHLLIDGRKIVAVGIPEDISADGVDEAIDFSDHLVLPGLVFGFADAAAIRLQNLTDLPQSLV